MRRQSLERAFTLVELLVVIGIIALLVSILLPTLNRARESAKNIQCLSNMRNMGNAEIMYASSWKGWGVPHIMGKGSNRDWRANPAFRRYMGIPDTISVKWPLKLHCPNATRPYLDADKNKMADLQYSYAYNTTNMKTEYDGTGTLLANVIFRGIKASRVRQSSTKLMFADGMDWNITYSGSNRYMNPKNPGCNELRQGSSATNYVAYRHSRKFDRINCTFWDGHAATMRRDEIACCDNWQTWPGSSNKHPNYHRVWDLSQQ